MKKQTKKQLRTAQWKAEQLKNSISELCNELVNKSKEAAQKKWEEENKNNSDSRGTSSDVLND